jgi:hypothetical protein
MFQGGGNYVLFEGSFPGDQISLTNFFDHTAMTLIADETESSP